MPLRFWTRPTCLCLSALALFAAAVAAREPTHRGIAVEGIRNEQSGFVVRVDVDHADRVYLEGELIRATVRSERDGYLYLLYRDAQDQTYCLFPNDYQTDNRIRAGQTVTVPAEGDDFRLRVVPPLGTEVLKAVVVKSPLSLEQLGVRSLTEASATPLDGATVRGIRVEAARSNAAADWAEHQVTLRTVSQRAGAGQAKRYGVIVAVAEYGQRGIHPLPACKGDARMMEEVFSRYGRMTETIVLTDAKATRANVEEVFRILREKTAPGDEIIVYWTGHGASVADTSGDEKDGYDEVLVTYDTQRADAKNTGVLDDVLRRWVQDLDQRRLLFIFDTCYAGGFMADEGAEKTVAGKSAVGGGIFDSLKSALEPAEPPASGVRVPSSILDNEFQQTKDIGQRETAVLSASAARQISLVRNTDECSVMTGFLVDYIREHHARGPIALDQVFRYVAGEVPKYVKVHYPDMSQEPALQDNLSSPLYLCP